MVIYRFNRETDVDRWNDFVFAAKNQTFLFNRGFMDYHMDRFEDHSLIITNEKGNIVGLFPANQSGNNAKKVISHEGLTYGGLIMQKDVKLKSVISFFHQILQYYSSVGIEELILKDFPAFYNLSPTNEVDFIMYILGARLQRRDVAFVIDYKNRINYSANIRRDGNKAGRLGIDIIEQENMGDFWNEILVPNLKQRYGVAPVHSITEINSLKQKFPNEIRQFDAIFENHVVAGTTIFYTNNIAHCQYISANEKGRQTGALNYLFTHLIDSVFSNCRYFDFGIVTENNGLSLNEGMLFWKESFGGRAHKQDFYSIDTFNHNLLEKYL